MPSPSNSHALFSPVLLLAVTSLALALLAPAARAQDESTGIVPAAAALSPAVEKALSAPWLTDDERSALRVFHGVWDQRDLKSPALQAQAALLTWRLADESLSNPDAPPELRAHAALLRGDLDLAFTTSSSLPSNFAHRIAAQAAEQLGNLHAARAACKSVVDNLLRLKHSDPAELTEGVRTLFINARLEGQPARDFQTMLDLLGTASQELDRLHWPAHLAAAELLFEKDNAQEAVAAAHQVLSLNPRCSDAWYMLGLAALEVFDFDSAHRAILALRRLNPDHPLADLLHARSRLVQDDPLGAQQTLDSLTARLPSFLPALALKAAAAALQYDQTALDAALAHFQSLSPGSPLALFEAGRFLSLNRQYDLAADLLSQAAQLRPAWPAPQVELGLLEMQSARDDRALAVLKDVALLDPFNKRAANSLFLLQDLQSYALINTPHFIIRYKPGVDDVCAQLMADELERIHLTVSSRFRFTPDRKTLIDLLPDHQRFAVRITGMPAIHTIAACTGPLIAIESPREGAPNKHLGLFDWPRVIQHEYTHTITLAQTGNRIPHWLTEAAAVSMEPGPRTYETCLMLAQSFTDNSLFNLDEIKWAFVRPRLPTDRSKAYAQGFWMVQYINHRFGPDALVDLMHEYFQGRRESQAIPNVLKISREQFFSDFLLWAGEQVNSWGLNAQPPLESLLDQLRAADPDLSTALAASQQARIHAIVEELTRQIGRPSPGPGRASLKASGWPDLIRPPVEISDTQLSLWLDTYPDHPDLIELRLRRLLKTDAGEDTPALVSLLQRYAALRPVDPFPHKKLAQIALAANDVPAAIRHLEILDSYEDKSPVFALKLAELYRSTSDFPNALLKIRRAVNINPYSAPAHELAAAIALQAADLPLAKRYIHFLTLIEPDRPQHQKRLQAIQKLLAAQPTN